MGKDNTQGVPLPSLGLEVSLSTAVDPFRNLEAAYRTLGIAMARVGTCQVDHTDPHILTAGSTIGGLGCHSSRTTELVGQASHRGFAGGNLVGYSSLRAGWVGFE